MIYEFAGYTTTNQWLNKFIAKLSSYFFGRMDELTDIKEQVMTNVSIAHHKKVYRYSTCLHFCLPITIWCENCSKVYSNKYVEKPKYKMVVIHLVPNLGIIKKIRINLDEAIIISWKLTLSKFFFRSKNRIKGRE